MVIQSSELGIEVKSITPVRYGEIHIVFAVDSQYVQHMGVAMTSVVINNPKVNCHFHIIYHSLGDDDLRIIRRFSDMYQAAVEMYKITDTSLFDSIATHRHFSKAAYYRIMIPDILPSYLQRVIYLDADLVCDGSLTELWNIDMNVFPLAAKVEHAAADQIVRLGLKNNLYLNSGVLLFNLPMWRREELSKRIIEFALAHPEKLEWVDQDAIAAILDGQIAPLDVRFNSTIDCATGAGEVLADSVIIHFVGACKPWQKWCPDKRKKIYWDYLNRSLWYPAKPEEPQTLFQALFAAKLENMGGNVAEVGRLLDTVIERLQK